MSLFPQDEISLNQREKRKQALKALEKAKKLNRPVRFIGKGVSGEDLIKEKRILK